MNERDASVEQGRERVDPRWAADVAEVLASIPASASVEQLRTWLADANAAVREQHRRLLSVLPPSTNPGWTIDAAVEFIRRARDVMEPRVGQVVRIKSHRHGDPLMTVVRVRAGGDVDVAYVAGVEIRQLHGIPCAALDPA